MSSGYHSFVCFITAVSFVNCIMIGKPIPVKAGKVKDILPHFRHIIFYQRGTPYSCCTKVFYIIKMINNTGKISPMPCKLITAVTFSVP